MKQLFYIVILCVLAQALTFTYVKGAKVLESEAEGIELEDCSAENDGSEEMEEEMKDHCPFWEPFTKGPLFFTLSPSLSISSEEFAISHILPVECPPPRG